ncbi:nucleotidyltransferase domain-containing protein [Ferroplasma sp.]|uniref:nucleotidyltransferase domain-containing protein n=1 Tax=Ferroplasma sp. TaxID=2591003 RepID=UPI00307E6B4B
MQRKYSDSVPKIFSLNYDLIIKKLREYGKKCSNKGSILTVLIGSLANGNYTPFSDADVIIITRDKMNVLDFMPVDLPIDVEPRLYPVEKIYEMSSQKLRIVHEIINGIILSGDIKIMDKIKKFYNE